MPSLLVRVEKNNAHAAHGRTTSPKPCRKRSTNVENIVSIAVEVDNINAQVAHGPSRTCPFQFKRRPSLFPERDEAGRAFKVPTSWGSMCLAHFSLWEVAMARFEVFFVGRNISIPTLYPSCLFPEGRL
jgi:hypothetical protein